MSTGIQWTDETWNPVVGCTRVSAGCDHCYAFDLHDKRYKANRDFARAMAEQRDWLVGVAGGLGLRRPTDAEAIAQARTLGPLPMPSQYDQPFSRVQLLPERLEKPLHWKAPRKIFVNSISDLFHPDVPDGFIVRVLMTMRRTPQHIYQVLTKRPERARDFFTRWADLSGEDGQPKLVRGPQATRDAHPSGRGQLFADYLESLASETGGEPPPGAAWPTFDWMEGPRWWSTAPLPNVWLGTSVENQTAADERIPHLLATPAAVRFLSCEPLLGPLDLDSPVGTAGRKSYPLRLDETMNLTRYVDAPWARIDWVIVGGESGPHARPCNEEWIRSIVRQCHAAAVPVFVKQLGSRPYDPECPHLSRDGVLPLTSIGGDLARQVWHCGECGGLIGLRSRHGSDPEEWPEDLRVREFPEVQR